MKKLNKSITLILFLILSHSQFIVTAQGPEVCQREAVIYCDFYQAYLEDVFSKNAAGEEFCDAVKPKLTQLFTRDRFKIIPYEPFDANLPQNEYHFEIKYTGITNYSGPPTPRLTLNLNFENERFSELVHFWEVEESGEGLTAQETIWPKLLNTLEQRINAGPDIIDIIEKFEKRPVNLLYGTFKETLDPGEEMDINLYVFTDERGEMSREFNRIIVHTDVGEILNGTICDIGPDYVAYQVDRNNVTVCYKAPENCKKITAIITVYNSCDVLPEKWLTMNKTKIKDRLIEKDIILNCYDAKITVTKRYNKKLKTSYEDTNSEEVHKHNLDESIEATATIYLELTETQDMPIFKQTWQYYKPTSVSLSSFNYNSKENKYSSGPKYTTNIDYSRNVKKHEIEEKESSTQVPWVLIIDNETEKAVKLLPAGYGIAYEIKEMEKMKSVVYSDQGTKRDTKTTQKTRSKTFMLSPVGEEVQDPTIKKSDNWIHDYLKQQGVELPPGVPIPKISNKETVKKIKPDILVKSGDGKYSFGGEGSRTTMKELEHGKEEINLNYNWQMTIKRKDK